MTVSIPIDRDPQRRAFHLAHEAVCLRCGHGESLHPQRELGCLLCDQRAEVGLVSAFCVGFVADLPAALHH